MCIIIVQQLLILVSVCKMVGYHQLSGGLCDKLLRKWNIIPLLPHIPTVNIIADMCKVKVQTVCNWQVAVSIFFTICLYSVLLFSTVIINFYWFATLYLYLALYYYLARESNHIKNVFTSSRQAEWTMKLEQTLKKSHIFTTMMAVPFFWMVIDYSLKVCHRRYKTSF